MAVPAGRYGPERTEDDRGLVLVADQIALGDPAVSKTATASAGAVTLNTPSGSITTESLSTAAGSTYTLTLTNSCIGASDLVFFEAGLGTSTTGTPCLCYDTTSAGQAVLVIKNVHASAALNGTLVIDFFIVKQ